MIEEKSALKWLEEIEIEDLLTGDSELIYQHCGREVLVSLWEHLSSLNLYVSTKPLDAARRRYIKAHFNGGNIKHLAALLRVSESFIYKMLEEEQHERQRG